MAYDQGLAQRLREMLAEHDDVEEKKMFGGLAMMLNGNMCVGIIGEELMVRVGSDAYQDALSQTHARKMDFTGKPLKGFIYVACEGFESDDDLRAWVDRAVSFVLSLGEK
jgi:TfoX/Sxy family transcriptional regulator of competence genes